MTTSSLNRKRVVVATPNHSKRSFTLRVKYHDGDSVKYRTTPMSQNEFAECLNYTQADWQDYLKHNNYFIIKK